MFIFPIYKTNQMTNEIDSGLIYTVSYMTVLATSGISIEEILERVAEVEDNPSIKKVASRFVADIKLFGKDLEQALVAITEHSSSVLVSKLMDRIMNTVWSSGDLKSLLEYESERLLQLKHEQMKKTLNSLTYLGEIYVAMMIVAPILFIIMFSLLSVIGGNASNTSILLNLVVFLGLPVVASMFLIILDTMIGADW
jgi:flagellar protein FlaJ